MPKLRGSSRRKTGIVIVTVIVSLIQLRSPALGTSCTGGMLCVFFALINPCLGDCNDDGQVTVNEVLTLVNIALGSADVDVCLAGDIDDDGRIAVDEILAAVNGVLTGCVAAATASPPCTARTVLRLSLPHRRARMPAATALAQNAGSRSEIPRRNLTPVRPGPKIQVTQAAGFFRISSMEPHGYCKL